jgi:hypothetical protein
MQGSEKSQQRTEAEQTPPSSPRKSNTILSESSTLQSLAPLPLQLLESIAWSVNEPPDQARMIDFAPESGDERSNGDDIGGHATQVMYVEELSRLAQGDLLFRVFDTFRRLVRGSLYLA